MSTMKTVLVNLSQGTLRGRKVVSNLNGISFYSFKGIPYAKAPVGALRFKAPQPPEPWTGVRDAFNEGEVAPQISIVNEKYVGHENCLFLNVYTPSLQPNAQLPVMVFIHGGGMYHGSGNSDVHGPDYFVARDVIVVTINYRLGALGFVALSGTDTSQNNVLRDQVAALKWVKENITKFGGDVNNVTLMGHSSGACNVYQLVLSPVAKGLFHRVICQSGSAFTYCAYTSMKSLEENVKRLARALKCPSEQPQEIIDFLRSVPPQKLVKYQMSLLTEEENRIMCAPFITCIEHPGPEAILPGPPDQLIRENKFLKVPIITGTATGDGKLFLVDLTKCHLLNEIDRDFEFIVPTNLAEKRRTERCREMAQKIRGFYFGDKKVSEETIVNYVEMETDVMFNYPLYTQVKLLAESDDPPPVYFYQFDHKKQSEDIYLSKYLRALPGAAHCDDLFYIFKPHSPKGLQRTTADLKVCSVMMKLWTNFMKTGNPNSSDFQFYWPPVTEDKFPYLNITEEPKIMNDFKKDSITFLEKLHEENKEINK